MFKRNSVYKAVVTVMAFLLVLGAGVQGVAAQRSTNEVEFVGTISAISGTTLTVAGRVVDASRAEMKVRARVGLLVKVEGTLGANGVVVAREVEQPDQDDLNERDDIEFTGAVSALNGKQATIGGWTVDLSKAEVKVTLRVGLLVKVEGTLGANNVVVAREVKRPGKTNDDANDNSRRGGRGSSGGGSSDDDGSDDRGGQNDDNDSNDDKGGDNSGRGKGGKGGSDDSGSDDD